MSKYSSVLSRPPSIGGGELRLLGGGVDETRRWGGEWGEGIPLSSRLRGLGSVVSSPSGVRGRAPAENEFGAL